MNRETFQKLLKELNLICDEYKYELLKKYSRFLLEYNEHTNLTSIKEEQEVFIKHFYDSLTLTKLIDLDTLNEVLDIGTGAGFPGIVLKIFYPNIKLTLLDSNNKKTTFLKQLVDYLDIKNVQIINDRAENLTKTKINYYDLVTARAVANLRVLSEISIPLVKNNGYFIALKGINQDEIQGSEKTIEKMSCKITDKICVQLPNTMGTRTIIKIQKYKASDINKLRPYSKIIKSELK